MQEYEDLTVRQPFQKATMSISAVSSNTPIQAAPKASPVEAAEATRAGKDMRNDGDADDGGAAAVATKALQQPTTNTLGQQIGKNLNVTA